MPVSSGKSDAKEPSSAIEEEVASANELLQQLQLYVLLQYHIFYQFIFFLHRRVSPKRPPPPDAGAVQSALAGADGKNEVRGPNR